LITNNPCRIQLVVDEAAELPEAGAADAEDVSVFAGLESFSLLPLPEALGEALGEVCLLQ
jgi:hypothetical protein